MQLFSGISGFRRREGPCPFFISGVARRALAPGGGGQEQAAIPVRLVLTRPGTPGGWRRLLGADALQRELAWVAELASLDAMEQKTLKLMLKDQGAASAVASVSKIHGSTLRQRVTELAVEVMGPYALPQQPRLMEHGSLGELIGEPTANTAVSVAQYFGDRAMTIASGSTEVQKNIIATRVLGL